MLDAASGFTGLLMAEHAEISGELVRDGLSLGAQLLGDGSGGGCRGGPLDQREAFFKRGQMALPEIVQKSLNFSIGLVAHRLRLLPGRFSSRVEMEEPNQVEDEAGGIWFGSDWGGVFQ